MKVYEHSDGYFEKTPIEKQRVFCNCDHRKAVDRPFDRCELDGHYISYVSCFTNWCRKWRENDE